MPRSQSHRKRAMMETSVRSSVHLGLRAPSPLLPAVTQVASSGRSQLSHPRVPPSSLQREARWSLLSKQSHLGQICSKEPLASGCAFSSLAPDFQCVGVIKEFPGG